MKKLIPVLCILFSFSCGHSQSDTANASPLQKDTAHAAVPQKDTVDIFLNTVNSLAKRSAVLTVKEVEGLLHEKYFTAAEFRVTPRQSVTGKLNIYSVQLTGDIPTALHPVYTFIDISDKHLQFLLPIEFNQLYQINDRIMIGGIYALREQEYYSVYAPDSTVLKRIFDTGNTGGERIMTGYFTDDECIDYTPDRLHFQYNKQTNDILFTGNAKKYCRPGRDRAKGNKAIESMQLKLVFHYNNATWELDKKQSHYLTW